MVFLTDYILILRIVRKVLTLFNVFFLTYYAYLFFNLHKKRNINAYE